MIPKVYIYLFAFAIIFAGLGTAAYKAYKFHTESIETAVKAAEESLLLEQNKLINLREEELYIKSSLEREKLESSIQVEKKRVSELERQLLIEHDLDRLLQREPGLILNIVNDGTTEYYNELREITQ